jgi:hypothetical protein
MHYAMIGQMRKQLLQVDKWLDMATAFAKERNFEPDLFLQARLTVDQFPLVRQVQTACDTVKLAAARLSGKEAPKHEDNEKTIDELHTRVRAVVEWLGGFSEADFAQAATRVITQPRWKGKSMTGADYFLEHAVPNFYFHTAHTYALLRHNGVPIGKRDYLGALTMSETAA